MAPSLDLDPFSPEFLADPYPAHAALRAAGAAVWLPRSRFWVSARYADVRAALRDWEAFSAAAGVGVADFSRERPWRLTSPLLEADPPEHSCARRVFARVMTPTAIQQLADESALTADRFVAQLADGTPFDAMKDMVIPYMLRMFSRACGVPSDRADSIFAGARFVWNPDRPRIDMIASTVPESGPTREWISQNCGPDALLPDGMGTQIHEHAIAAGFAPMQATLLVRTLLSAGLETVVHGLGNTLWCLATHPDEFARLRADPSLARSAFEEVMRFESPAPMFFRTTTRDVDMGGVTVPKGNKIMLLMGSANRDPGRWSDADRFDITRRTSGHLGFGAGNHACIGLTLARLHGEVVLSALTRHVSAIELADEPKRMVHSTLRGLDSLPLRFVP